MRPDFLFPQVELPVPITDDTLEDLGSVLTLDLIGPYIAEQMALIRQDKMWQYARSSFFNDDGTPWEMSPGELAIYKCIVFRQHPRNEIICSTQYGKSLTVARALLTRLTTYPDDWLNVVPDTKRGRIILNYIIKDTARNDYFRLKLTGKDLGSTDALNHLLEEKSKVKLTYAILEEGKKPTYSSIEILSGQAKRVENSISAIMGFGGRNIISEEASLVNDDVDAGIFRMLAGKGADTFLVKIGNPFKRNHFLSTWKDPTYFKIFINEVIAQAEGRYTAAFLEEAKKKPQYDVLYKSKFPSAAVMDDAGWMQLLSEEEIRLAMQTGVHFGDIRFGADPSDEGDNFSVLVQRSRGYAEILYRDDHTDLMAFSGIIFNEAKQKQINQIYLDRVGVGSGIFSRMNEVNRVDFQNKFRLTGVNAGEPVKSKEFFNKRAEMFWRVREWIKSGGKLSKDQAWYELATIRYKTDSAGGIQIMSKIEMRKRKIASPDVADALALTFYDPPTLLSKLSEEDKFFMRKMLQNKKTARLAGRH